MKKVISFVLVLALVLGSFSMAFALTDVEGDANEAAINVVNDLGIVTGYTDGTFQADKAVNRAEFAAMITRALNIPESALAGYTSTSFKDTTGYGWAVKYLAFCNDKGIMLGDGNGNAMPGRTINMNEAMTMALRAVGLTDSSALLVGAWPANYVTVAKANDLYDGVDAVTTVDRGTAAQIIYNMLMVDGFTVNADGVTEQITAGKLIDDLSSYSYDEIVVYDETSLIALADYIGAYATVYYNSDDEIIAIDPISTFLEGTYNADGTFTVGNVDYKGVSTSAVSVTPAALNIINGATTTTAIGFTPDEDYTLAVEYAGKTVKTIYSASAWVITKADLADEDVQEELADDKTLLGEKFVLDNNDEIKAGSYELKGVAKLEDIAEDDVVYVYTDGDVIVKVEVGTKTVTGQITKYISKDDAYVIGGETLEKATTNEIVGSEFVVENKGTARLDYAGNVYAWELEEAAKGDYAVVIGVGQTNEATTIDTKSDIIKLFTEDGEEKTFVVDDEATGVTAAATTLEGNGYVAEYTLNKDGEIDSITTAATYQTVTGAPNDAGTLIGTWKIAKDVVLFVEEDDDWSIGTMADLGDTVTLEAVKNDDGIIVAAVAHDEDDLTAASDDDYGIIVALGDEILNADGDMIPVADVIYAGTLKTEVEAKASETFTYVTDAALALVTLEIDADGVLTSATAITTDGSIIDRIDVTTVVAVDAEYITVDVEDVYDITGAVVYVYSVEDDAWTVGSYKDLEDATNVYLWHTDLDDNSVIDIIVAHVE